MIRLISKGACWGMVSCLSKLLLVSSGFGMESDVDNEALRRAMASGSEEIAFHIGKAEFVLKRVPPGDFNLGSKTADKMAQPNEMPVRRVHMTRAFYIGKFKVTQLQYREVIGKNPSKFHGDSLPVEDVSYAKSLQFCATLSKLLGVKVTLPTEAQWEYACRAGTDTRFYSGDEESDLDKVAWYKKNSGAKTHDVGTKKPNAWGLYDMLGNVWEPCLDSLPAYTELAVDNADPVGKVHEFRGHMRGGGWYDPAEDCRAATRILTDDMFGGMGIRIVINLEKNGDDGRGKRAIEEITVPSVKSGKEVKSAR